MSDLEKKIDNFEKKKKKRKASKEKKSRKQSRENSMTRSHKSGELAKRIPRMQTSMTQRSAGTNSKERSISQKTFKRMAALGTSVRNNNENKKHQPVIK